MGRPQHCAVQVEEALVWCRVVGGGYNESECEEVVAVVVVWWRCGRDQRPGQTDAQQTLSRSPSFPPSGLHPPSLPPSLSFSSSLNALLPYLP